MPKLTSHPNLLPEYRRLRQSLAQTGWIALGSLIERTRPGQGGTAIELGS
jgi:hypothetical protein